jgi:hypothetical protein
MLTTVPIKMRKSNQWSVRETGFDMEAIVAGKS